MRTQWIQQNLPWAVALCNFAHCLVDSSQHPVLAQHRERFKQRRGILATADRDTYGLKHLSGFDAQLLRRRAQSVVERVVSEFSLSQRFAGFVQYTPSHRRVPFLRDEFGGIVCRKLIDKEKVGRSENIPQQLDALTDQGRDL